MQSNLKESKWLESKLRELGFNPVTTSANFIYFESAEDAGELARRLQAEGVIVRPMKVWGAPQAIRVTVGTTEQNQRFAAALKLVRERAAVR